MLDQKPVQVRVISVYSWSPGVSKFVCIITPSPAYGPEDLG